MKYAKQLSRNNKGSAYMSFTVFIALEISAEISHWSFELRILTLCALDIGKNRVIMTRTPRTSRTPTVKPAPQPGWVDVIVAAAPHVRMAKLFALGTTLYRRRKSERR